MNKQTSNIYATAFAALKATVIWVLVAEILQFGARFIIPDAAMFLVEFVFSGLIVYLMLTFLLSGEASPMALLRRLNARAVGRFFLTFFAFAIVLFTLNEAVKEFVLVPLTAAVAAQSGVGLGVPLAGAVISLGGLAVFAILGTALPARVAGEGFSISTLRSRARSSFWRLAIELAYGVILFRVVLAGAMTLLRLQVEFSTLSVENITAGAIAFAVINWILLWFGTALALAAMVRAYQKT